MLTVVRFSHMSEMRNSFLVCACACGTEVVVSWVYLNQSKNPNCGCVPWKSPTPRVSVEHRKAMDATWRAENKGKLKAKYKQWHKENWPTLSVKVAVWRAKNPEKVKAIAKRFRSRHAVQIKAEKAAYSKATAVRREVKRKQRMLTDPQFRLATSLRSRTCIAIRRGYGKKSKSTAELLGCSLAEFRVYFESLFTSEMSWSLFLAGGIHIDHKVPCRNFDLRDPAQQKLCFHWSNLQPLLAADNLSKSDLLPCGRRARDIAGQLSEPVLL